MKRRWLLLPVVATLGFGVALIATAGSGAGPVATGATPVASGATPVASGATPVASGATPAASGATPAASGATPAASGATPAASGATPAASGATPAASGATPAASGAPSSSASFTAVDFAWEVSGGTSTTATIAQGGTVTFAYPKGFSAHNADFFKGPKPTSCKQTAGTSSGAVPPLPHQATGAGWSGTCTFDTPGTYTFHCDLHNFMEATITVESGGTTSSTTSATSTSRTTSSTGTTSSPGAPTTSSTPTPGAGGGTSGGSASHPVLDGSPLVGSKARAIRMAARQHGYAVRGSLHISAAGAGARAEVDLFGRRAVLRGGTRAHHRAHVRSNANGRGVPEAETSARRLDRVGRLLRRALHAGIVPFRVPLDRAAHRALQRSGRLDLVVSITIRSRHGRRIVVTRPVTLLR